MTSPEGRKWLLLIHQLPPQPNALRVKIWRRLQQVGAVAIKQSVYVMPLSEQSQEDLSWTLKQIVSGGGDGSIGVVRFVEGLTDEQVIALFQTARKSDYQKIIQEANTLLTDWSAGTLDPQDPAVKGAAQVSKLQRRFEEVATIDFFQAPERGTAEILIQDLAARLSGQSSSENAGMHTLDGLNGKIWVTRKNLFVDRIACGWLIRRFVDKSAVFKFVDADTHTPEPDQIRFDMFDGEYTHEGDRCTFEVMVQRFGLRHRGLVLLAEVIHDIDLKDGKYDHAETNGLNALLSGLVASRPDDDQRMDEGMQLIDNLYAYFQRQKGKLAS
ncbi:chromate resistance protein ChrB domain-containing protein [uncultured Desulfosarcina sp.]|uniref:chromate resistance protein ChrB domain-containing protein n=1 Tax=uncultured Desulfosarcina sp. TaxID=218289 RepID=UPI0029C771B7|nr:chromate resistance protein ChrB domain-containing protein [uncultured Desulfosarcina sp.]